MKTLNLESLDFSPLSYGIYADIVGRRYEAAFLFLRDSRSHPAISDKLKDLVMSLRTAYPFEKLKQAWQDSTGTDLVWNMLSGYLETHLDYSFSDDTVLTMATIDALRTAARNRKANGYLKIDFAQKYRFWVARYPRAGYSRTFKEWYEDSNVAAGYSTANGSAMRVAPIGFLKCHRKVLHALAEESAIVSHNSPQAILGAQIVAETVQAVRQYGRVRQICERVLETHFKKESRYASEFPLGSFESGCLPTVRHCLAILAHHSGDFASLLRTVLGRGGDVDTIGMICGSIWGAGQREESVPSWISALLSLHLPAEMKLLLTE